jgi:hypothetical protein
MHFFPVMAEMLVDADRRERAQVAPVRRTALAPRRTVRRRRRGGVA